MGFGEGDGSGREIGCVRETADMSCDRDTHC